MLTIFTTTIYNQFGQPVRATDPEGNVTELEHFPENDPDGDGTVNNAGGNATTGGYLRQVTVDTTSSAARNSGTDPTPVNVRSRFGDDPVGNLTSTVNGRGIRADFVVNELNQVVQVTSAAAHDVFTLDPVEPVALTDFAYIQRFHFDHNNNLVLSQVEDRGNTSSVDGNPPAADLPSVTSDPDPAGGTAFVDSITHFDILDRPIESVVEVSNGVGPHFLRSRARYDANGNLVLTIQPEGNASGVLLDERDMVFQTVIT